MAGVQGRRPRAAALGAVGAHSNFSIPIEVTMRTFVRRTAKHALFSGCGLIALCASGVGASAGQPILLPNSLVISSSTYDQIPGRRRVADRRHRAPQLGEGDHRRRRRQRLRRRLEQRVGRRQLRRDVRHPADGHRAAQRSCLQVRVGASQSGGHELSVQVGGRPAHHQGPNADRTWCSSATPAPGSARSTCRTPTRSRGRTRPTR